MPRHAKWKVSCKPNKVELGNMQNTDKTKTVLLFFLTAKYLWLLQITFSGYGLYHSRNNFDFSANWKSYRKSMN